MNKVSNAVSEYLKDDIPAFRSGDTINVGVKVIEGNKTRVQNFEGIVIAISAGCGTDKTFTIRKISNGVGVERIFPLHSPNIDFIKVIKKGKVRRAKLYYLRNRSGKSTRIADKSRGEEVDQYAITDNQNEETISDKTNDDIVKDSDQEDNKKLAEEENKESQENQAENKSVKNGEESKK